MYPRDCKYIAADKKDKYNSYDSTIRFKTANGMAFGY